MQIVNRHQHMLSAVLHLNCVNMMSAWCRSPALGCGVWAASCHQSASSPIRSNRPLAVVEVTTSGHGKRTCSRIGSSNSYLLFGHFRLCRLVMTSGRQRSDGGCPLKILTTMSRSQSSSARWRIAGRVVIEHWTLLSGRMVLFIRQWTLSPGQLVLVIGPWMLFPPQLLLVIRQWICFQEDWYCFHGDSYRSLDDWYCLQDHWQ